MERCTGLQMHRNSKIVCTALGTVLCHQCIAQFHSQNYYTTFPWGLLLLHTNSLNNSRKDFNTIANSNDLLILFSINSLFASFSSFFLISYFFLIFSPWLAGVSFTFNINPMLFLMLGVIFPVYYLSSTLSVVSLRRYSLFLSSHNYLFFFLCFAFAVLLGRSLSPLETNMSPIFHLRAL